MWKTFEAAPPRQADELVRLDRVQYLASDAGWSAAFGPPWFIWWLFLIVLILFCFSFIASVCQPCLYHHFMFHFIPPLFFSLWEFFISVCATIPLISSDNILFKQWEDEWDFLFFFDIHQTLFLFKNTNLVQIVRSLFFLIFHLLVLPCLERPCPRSHPSGSWGMLII